MTKKIITDRIPTLNSFAGLNIDSSIEMLVSWKNEYGNTARFEEEYDYEARELYLVYEREETDKEYNARLKVEARIAANNKRDKQQCEAHERKLLAKLKKKYENA